MAKPVAPRAAVRVVDESVGGHGPNDDFIKQVRENVTPGTSAPFVMTSNVVADKVDQLKETGATLIVSDQVIPPAWGVDDHVIPPPGDHASASTTAATVPRSNVRQRRRPSPWS